MIENVMVFVIVIAAVGFALRFVCRTVSGKKSHCGSCPSDCSCSDRPVNIKDGC